jgi:hypothetical protein
MKVFFIIVVGLLGSWNLMDLSSQNTLKSGIAPIVFVFFLTWSLLWLIVLFGRERRSSGSSYFVGDIANASGGVSGAGDGGDGSC